MAGITPIRSNINPKNSIKESDHVVRRLLLLFVLVSVIAAGCIGGGGRDQSPEYRVSGKVTTPGGEGVDDVTISFGKFGIAETDGTGNWSKDGLKGKVQAEYAKDDWIFWPPGETLSGARSDIAAVGNPNGEGYYPLVVGNYWVYQYPNGVRREEVTKVETINGLDVFTLQSTYTIDDCDEWDDCSVPDVYVQVWRDSDGYYFGDPEEDDRELAIPVPIEIGSPDFPAASISIGRVTVPAGTFTAIMIERDYGNGVFNRIWYVPYVGIVKSGIETLNDDGDRTEEYMELVEYDFNW